MARRLALTVGMSVVTFLGLLLSIPGLMASRASNRTPHPLELAPKELAAIRAGLRCLTTNLRDGLVVPNQGLFVEMLTDGGRHKGLTASQVSELADRIGSTRAEDSGIDANSSSPSSCNSG